MTEGKTVKAGSLRVTYEHGGQLRFAIGGFEDIVFNPAKASVENRHLAQLLGWKNRIGDGAAVSADPATGRVDPQAKWDKVRALVDFYEAGGTEWAVRAAGGGAGARDDAGLVVQALMRVWARDLDATNAAVEKLAAKRGVDRAALLKDLGKSADVLRVIGEIKAERAAAATRVNAADMLDELDELDALGDDAPGSEAAPF